MSCSVIGGRAVATDPQVQALACVDEQKPIAEEAELRAKSEKQELKARRLRLKAAKNEAKANKTRNS